MLQRSSKYHYRFADTREILLIGDDVYAAELNAGFDPEGIRFGVKRLMTKSQWDEIENWSIQSRSFRIVDGDVEWMGDYAHLNKIVEEKRRAIGIEN